MEVVQIAAERHTSVAGELLGACLGLRNYREHWKGQHVLLVDR
jgi:hypothetical protein